MSEPAVATVCAALLIPGAIPPLATPPAPTTAALPSPTKPVYTVVSINHIVGTCAADIAN